MESWILSEHIVTKEGQSTLNLFYQVGRRYTVICGMLFVALVGIHGSSLSIFYVCLEFFSPIVCASALFIRSIIKTFVLFRPFGLLGLLGVFLCFHTLYVCCLRDRVSWLGAFCFNCSVTHTLVRALARFIRSNIKRTCLDCSVDHGPSFPFRMCTTRFIPSNINRRGNPSIHDRKETLDLHEVKLQFVFPWTKPKRPNDEQLAVSSSSSRVRGRPK